MEPVTLLEKRRIVLAVTGSIACYKAVDLASKLTQAGAAVDVILSEAAQRFVQPLTFQAVTGRPVYTSMWHTGSGDGLPTHIAHVGLAEDADLIAVVPATASTLFKLAHGAADTLLTVMALAARCPLLLAPAMDGSMYDHPAVQANVQTLVERGAYLVEPDEGRFASGLRGKGRLPETPALLGHIRRCLGQQHGRLSGRRVIVTAGGTREPLDPVRFIGNHSSGKQGYALAQAAIDAGAHVTLISTVKRPAAVGADVVSVQTAQEMLDALRQQLNAQAQTDALLMAAAIADFRPAQTADQKIKKQDDNSAPSIPLTRTPDILLQLKDDRAQAAWTLSVIVGFAAESENLTENAQHKLQKKALDFIIANDITATDAGFGSDYNRVLILDGQHSEAIARASKSRISERVIERVAVLLNDKTSHPDESDT
jgi:phosphopantothenoylcysteine decarboxylase/phosphopantothenate--cysteine ligase